MERTLKKGLSYQLRKFKANRRYKAPDATTIASDANPHKDRYIDIRCLDATRVVLRDNPSDYINANYIVSLTGRRFICTQAPLEKTKEDFWKMVVQERCRTIVMLCSDVDECKDKYANYHPTRVGDQMVVGKTIITSMTQFISCKLGYTVSILEVQHALSRFKLSHIHCTSWPDHSAPKDSTCVIAIHKMLLQNHLKRPVVVHCSAGIGRTCTFVG
ncbi:Protein-tyrosine phosphatase [Cooperia oncophora]